LINLQDKIDDLHGWWVLISALSLWPFWAACALAHKPATGCYAWAMPKAEHPTAACARQASIPTAPRHRTYNATTQRARYHKPTSFTTSTAAISFYDQIVVFEKRAHPKPEFPSLVSRGPFCLIPQKSGAGFGGAAAISWLAGADCQGPPTATSIRRARALRPNSTCVWPRRLGRIRAGPRGPRPTDGEPRAANRRWAAWEWRSCPPGSQMDPWTPRFCRSSSGGTPTREGPSGCNVL
jgi:hypothetical protein